MHKKHFLMEAVLAQALALLHRAKAYVNKYPSIGAQELSKELTEFLAAQDKEDD
jgi:hypothetical protein